MWAVEGLLSFLTVLGVYAYGRSVRLGALTGLLNNTLWTLWTITTAQWGFLLLDACLFGMHAYNLWRYYHGSCREESASHERGR